MMFTTKSKMFDMRFRGDRKKNINTLSELEITSSQMKEEILSLEPINYYCGPDKDTLNHGDDMWVFGKKIKGREVYIKITLGGYNNSTLCISFHIAEHKITYPFLDKKS